MMSRANEQALQRLERRGLQLEYATIGWNAIEMVISIGLGIAAGSPALIAFGLDTMVELFASLVVVRHLHHAERASDRVVAHSLRLVSRAFFVLAVIVAAGSLWALASRSIPDESVLGIIYLALTVIVMLALGWAKHRIGQQLESEPLAAEARMSVIDAALALGVLIGLAANALLGWWWADPLAALLVAGAAISEGVEHRERAVRTPRLTGATGPCRPTGGGSR